MPSSLTPRPPALSHRSQQTAAGNYEIDICAKVWIAGESQLRGISGWNPGSMETSGPVSAGGDESREAARAFVSGWGGRVEGGGGVTPQEAGVSRRDHPSSAMTAPCQACAHVPEGRTPAPPRSPL